MEDEQSIRDSLCELFEVEGARTWVAATLDEAKRALGKRLFDLIVTDIRLGARADAGIHVMAAAGMLSPDAMVIVLTAFPTADNRAASRRLGATYFLEKPADLATIAALAALRGVPTALLGSLARAGTLRH